MRAYIVASNDISDGGGESRTVKALAHAHRFLGYDTFIINPSSCHGSEIDGVEVIDIFRNLSGYGEQKLVSRFLMSALKFTNGHPNISLLLLPSFIKRRVEALYRIIIDAENDAIFFGVNHIASFALAKSGRRYYSICVGDSSRNTYNVYKERGGFEFLLQRTSKFLRNMEEVGYKNAEVVTTNGEDGIEYLRTLGVPDPIHLALPLDDFTRIRKVSKELARKALSFKEGYDFFIGFIGRIEESKGLDSLIESVAILKSKGLNPALIICGDGPAMRKHVDMAKKIGIHHFFFIGWRDDVWNFYNAVDLIVFPFRTKEKGGIGMSAALLEALASGSIVITTKVQNSQVNFPYIYHINSDSSKEIADAISFVMNSDVVSSSISKNAVKYTSEYHSFEHLTEALHNMYTTSAR